MSREDYEVFRVLRDERSDRGEQRRMAADKWFKELDTNSIGTVRVKRFTSTHYRVTCDGIAWDVWPGNCHIRRMSKRGPYLTLPSPWTMQDVVDAIRKQCNVTQ
jgi:hypothetical protein